jgi:hypothetical protein
VRNVRLKRLTTLVRAQKYDIAEGVCEQGSYTDAVDKNGDAIFAPVKFHSGVPVGSDSK